MSQRDLRARVLSSLGATASEAEELLAYNQNALDPIGAPLPVPLADEPMAAAWAGYEAESRVRGVFPVLRERLVQLWFPIRAGISATEAYRAATRRGVPRENLADATGLALKRPGQLSLALHPTPAGRVPVLLAPDREDFVALVRALAWRNEPAEVPVSQGACLVVGLNNWDRVRQLRQTWEATHPPDGDETAWQLRFQEIIPHKELYQDCVILLGDGPYSNVAAADLGLSEGAWLEASRTIRREHEGAHYVSRRVLGRRRYNMLDELLADYAGIVQACGSFRADWLLRFLGLEAFPHYRAGGRLENYRGQPPLSDRAFRVLQALASKAVRNLQEIDTAYRRGHDSLAHLLLALSHLTLEELASHQTRVLLEGVIQKQGLANLVGVR